MHLLHALRHSSPQEKHTKSIRYLMKRLTILSHWSLKHWRMPVPGSRLLLVVDQFEEIFTRAGEMQRRMFIEILRLAVTHENGRAHVLVTMRADFFDRLKPLPPFSQSYMNKRT